MTSENETASQLALQYNVSITDIRVHKDTQWKICTNTYLVYAGIIWAWGKLDCCLSLLVGLTFLAAILGIVGIRKTNFALENARDVIWSIGNNFSQAAKDIIGHKNMVKSDGSDSSFFVTVLISGIVIGAVLTILILLKDFHCSFPCQRS